MNLYIIIPALLMAVAAIAGIAYFAVMFRMGQEANDRLSAHAKQAREERDGLRIDIDKMKVKLEREYRRWRSASEALGKAKAQISIRDPKTGRFISAEEKLAQRMESYQDHSIPERAVTVTAGTDVAGPRIETTVVGWGRGGKPAWKE